VDAPGHDLGRDREPVDRRRRMASLLLGRLSWANETVVYPDSYLLWGLFRLNYAWCYA
jgi:hypothetical protein